MIKKGTEHFPAKPEEITNLQSQVKTVAMVPIIVGDHRLAVEIITPKTDMTLSPDKYGTLDQRITTTRCHRAPRAWPYDDRMPVSDYGDRISSTLGPARPTTSEGALSYAQEVLSGLHAEMEEQFGRAGF